MDWTLYDRDIGKATDALFMQISVQVETVMDTVINNLDAIAKAPLYASAMQDELRDGEILSSDSIAKIQYATESFNTADRLHHVIAIYNKNGHVAYFSSTTLVSYLLKNYYDLWYEAAKGGERQHSHHRLSSGGADVLLHRIAYYQIPFHRWRRSD